MPDIDKRASALMERHDYSLQWMEQNYYSEWEQVLMSFRCERDAEKDQEGKDDPTLTSIGTPLTTAYVNRITDRVTAQPPNQRFRAKDPYIAELVSRTQMYQWDKADMQRQQKKHVRQCGLFGWSVRSWWWEMNEVVRRKRVNPFDEAEATLKAIDLSYGDKVAETFGEPFMQMQPERRTEAIVWLTGKFGRGKLLDTAYLFKAYEGPKSSVLPIADVFPEPNFENFQEQNWFQVVRRRNKNWLQRLAKMYPGMKDGLNKLTTEHPKGTPAAWDSASGTTQNFRTRMARAYGGKRFQDETVNASDTNAWTIYEEHVGTGDNPVMRFVGEDNIWIGEIPYPYELEERIAFTDMVLIDDMVGGIGESLPRFFRGLQQLFDRHANLRWQLMNNVLRPLIGTNDLELWEDPKKLKRGNGFRLVYMRRGPGSMWQQNEQAAMAAAAAGAGENREMMMLYQLITGESNMSMGFAADNKAGSTATGVRAQSFQQDIITRGLNDMFVFSSLRNDANMMYLLNRSEMTEPIEFEPGRYNRSWSPDGDPIKQQWVKVEPIHFQEDGEVLVVAGSTIADDDDAKSQRAIQIWGAASARPDLYNQQKARDEYLKAMGQGDQLNEWAAPPPPPPPPKVADPVKPSLSVAVKFGELGMIPVMDPLTGAMTPMPSPLSPIQLAILNEAGIEFPPAPPQPAPPPPSLPQGALPGGPPPPMPPMPPPPLPPTGGGMGAPSDSAYNAAAGRT